MIWLANETTAVKSQIGLRLSFHFCVAFERRTMPSSFAFQLLFNPFNQDAKTAKGCYSRGIRPHSDSRKRARVFQWKLRKKELKVCGWKCQMLSCIWKKLQLFTALPACCKIARTNVNVEKTRLLAIVQLRAQEQVFNWLLVGWAMIRNYWGSIRWDDRSRRYKVSKRYFTGCKCCLSIFTEIKLLILNRDSSMIFSVVVVLLKYNFCLRNCGLKKSPQPSLHAISRFWMFISSAKIDR